MLSVQPESLSLRFGKKAYTICGIIRAISMLFMFGIIAGYILFAFGKTFNYQIAGNNILPVRIAGVIIVVVTAVIMVIGMINAGKEASFPDKNTKMYQGIYNYMRHPQTLGEMLFWLGIAMILNSLTLFIFSFIWIPVFILFTVIEDNDLALRFGQEYVEYTKKVSIFWKKPDTK